MGRASGDRFNDLLDACPLVARPVQRETGQGNQREIAFPCLSATLKRLDYDQHHRLQAKEMK